MNERFCPPPPTPPASMRPSDPMPPRRPDGVEMQRVWPFFALSFSATAIGFVVGPWFILALQRFAVWYDAYWRWVVGP